MVAIETRFHGPTNTRGPRYSATAANGQRVMIDAADNLHHEDNHRLAAETLCKKMGWPGKLAMGGTKRGYVFVFVD